MKRITQQVVTPGGALGYRTIFVEEEEMELKTPITQVNIEIENWRLVQQLFTSSGVDATLWAGNYEIRGVVFNRVDNKMSFQIYPKDNS